MILTHRAAQALIRTPSSAGHLLPEGEGRVRADASPLPTGRTKVRLAVDGPGEGCRGSAEIRARVVLMLLIDCPYCGMARPEIEFAYGGEAHIARPADPSAAHR